MLEIKDSVPSRQLAGGPIFVVFTLLTRVSHFVGTGEENDEQEMQRETPILTE